MKLWFSILETMMAPLGRMLRERHFVNLRFLERRSSKQGIPAPAISVAFAPFCDKSLS
jgi:hypothetical protein